MRASGTSSQYSSPPRRTKWFTAARRPRLPRRRRPALHPRRELVAQRPRRAWPAEQSCPRRAAGAAGPSRRTRRRCPRAPERGRTRPARAEVALAARRSASRASERNGEHGADRVRHAGVHLRDRYRRRGPGEDLRVRRVLETAEGKQDGIGQPDVEPVRGVVRDPDVALQTEGLMQARRGLRVPGRGIHAGEEYLQAGVVAAARVAAAWPVPDRRLEVPGRRDLADDVAEEDGVDGEGAVEGEAVDGPVRGGGI